MTENQKLLKQLLYSKLVNDERAREMAIILDKISTGKCAIFSDLELFEDTYLNMLNEFESHCITQLDLDSRDLSEQWCDLVLEDQIEILLGDQIDQENPAQCELCQHK